MIALNIENPIAKNVNVKDIVLNGSVPNDIIGGTALSPSETDGYVKAIVDGMTLVSIYPKKNFGNLYQRIMDLYVYLIAFFY